MNENNENNDTDRREIEADEYIANLGNRYVFLRHAVVLFMLLLVMAIELFVFLVNPIWALVGPWGLSHVILAIMLILLLKGRNCQNVLTIFSIKKIRDLYGAVGISCWFLPKAKVEDKKV